MAWWKDTWLHSVLCFDESMQQKTCPSVSGFYCTALRTISATGSLPPAFTTTILF